MLAVTAFLAGELAYRMAMNDDYNPVKWVLALLVSAGTGLLMMSVLHFLFPTWGWMVTSTFINEAQLYLIYSLGGATAGLVIRIAMPLLGIETY